MLKKVSDWVIMASLKFVAFSFMIISAFCILNYKKINFPIFLIYLQHTKRTGWVLRDVNDCESISGHMYRMSMMTFLLDGTEGLNQIRCMELALVHDLAESLVGDITPFCGVSKDDKRALEFKAMEDICKLIEPRGKRIMELFEVCKKEI